MISRRRFLAASAALSLPLPLPLAARADAAPWPRHPVRMVVTFPPGGASDIVARLLAPALQERLGQPFVTDNRPGAGSTIGAAAVAAAPADGYTLLMSNSAALSISPFLPGRRPYDPVRSFTHVHYIGAVPTVFAVHPSVPARTLPELAAWIRAQRDPVPFGSGGAASVAHIVGELFGQQAGLRLTHVPYKGAGPMRADLLGGQLPFAVDALPQNLPLMQSGALRLLAVTATQRVPQAPQLPTVAEAGFAGLVAENFVGVSAPANLSGDIVNRLHHHLNEILQQPAVRTRLEALGFVLAQRRPDEFAAYVRQQAQAWGPVVAATGASLS
ncbi:Bug family tripartite tricarboxylate transporter substrate binding protein [Cupriavidus sp. Agwp_2]|uniref:Bug family tripartite tricarboxylate transporter substrate binding protein n=1 Tax=Cupriavidus sp. Agwp_2 TaxID=2897324 RepID=UPI0034608C51